jgi:pimeloyl-ACP methyl ester carboxylesterase
MKIRTISLQLDNGETANFITAGEGSRICYIMGPGSFYLKGLSGELSGKGSSGFDQDITFVTCDGIWTRNKNDPLPDAKTIAKITAESILEREKFVISAIKSHFQCQKVALFGFSAPAALAFRYVLEHPEDIACVVGTGAGLCELDASFSKTTEAFKKQATPRRQERFDKGFENYLKIVKGESEAKPLVTDHFVEQEGRSRALTPTSDFLEQNRFLGPKLLVNDENSWNTIYEHWHDNPLEQVVCQPLREHFFGNIQPQLDSLSLLDSLEKNTKVPVLLVQGKHDFITPASKETVEKLRESKQIELQLYDNSAHMVYAEEYEQYVKNVRGFVGKYSSVCQNSNEKENKASSISVSSSVSTASTPEFTSGDFLKQGSFEDFTLDTPGGIKNNGQWRASGISFPEGEEEIEELGVGLMQFPGASPVLRPLSEVPFSSTSSTPDSQEQRDSKLQLRVGPPLSVGGRTGSVPSNPRRLNQFPISPAGEAQSSLNGLSRSLSQVSFLKTQEFPRREASSPEIVSSGYSSAADSPRKAGSRNNSITPSDDLGQNSSMKFNFARPSSISTPVLEEGELADGQTNNTPSSGAVRNVSNTG